MLLPSSLLVVLLENWQKSGFGLYIHWPFCAAKCPYCDFNSHVVSSIDQKRWEAAYLSEIERAASETPDRVLASVFFGGGTPSLMDPNTVAAILHKVRAAWTLANDFEVTLEANPSSVEAEHFAEYQQAGVTRISMGFQALNNHDLKNLGRLHSVQDSMKALDVARSTFDRVSFDLIYARQNQSLSEWESELQHAIALGPDHLSLYQLTIESGTAFGDRFDRGRLKGLPNEDLGADMYIATQDICEKAGLFAYEVSNHAKLGEECRHNLIYWRSGDYFGIGPGAHGRLTFSKKRFATNTNKSPYVWLKEVEASGSGESSRELVDPMDTLTESVMIGLRLNEGIKADDLLALPEIVMRIQDLIALDMLENSQTRIRATAKGRMLLNQVLKQLLA